MSTLCHIQVGSLKVILGAVVISALIFLCSTTQKPVLADAAQIIDGFHYPGNQVTSGERCKISTWIEVSCWVGVSKWEKTIPIKWGYRPVWIDNENLLVGGYDAREVSDSKGFVRTPAKYFVWSLSKGYQHIFEAKGRFCVGSGNTVVFKDVVGVNNLLTADSTVLAGKIGALNLTSFHEFAGIERATNDHLDVKDFQWREIDCSFVKLPENNAKKGDKVYLLNKQHGYFIRRKNGQIDVVSPNSGSQVLIDVASFPNSISLSEIRFLEFNQSYFLSASIPAGDPLGPNDNQFWGTGQSWQLVWYNPEKGLIVDKLPFGIWAKKLKLGSSVHPWRSGYLLESGSIVAPGLYAFTEKGVENIMPRSPGLRIQMSPNGCRAAVQTGIWGNDEKDWWKDPINLGPKLFVFDLCSN